MADSLTDQQPTNEPTALEGAGRYPHVVDYLLSAPWAIEPTKLRAIVDVVVHRAYLGQLPQERIDAAVAQRRDVAVSYLADGEWVPQAEVAAAGGRPPSGSRNLIAVMPVMGTILPRASAMDQSSGMFSLTAFRAQLRALVADPEVGGILLQFDSPGGSVALWQEALADIRSARARKPVGAVADTGAFSAAYGMFASATPDLQFVTPSGMVGSVGVITAHQDISAAMEALGVKTTLVTSQKAPYKAEGNPYEPLGADARAEMQKLVDSYHQDFRSALASGRKVSVTQVDEQFGGGRVFRASEAVDRGMAAAVGTFEDALSAVQSAVGERSASKSPRSEHDNQRDERPAWVSVDADALGARVAAGIAQGRD